MSKSIRESQSDKDCYLLAADAAAGDKNNDQITNCKICYSKGWPHEPITFEKVNGRVLSNGSNEVKKCIVRDYFTVHSRAQVYKGGYILKMATEIAETEYYDFAIDDPLLTEYGFTKFRIPINSNATRMELYNNKDRSMIIYPEFDKHDLDKSVKLLEDKLVKEQLVEGKAGKDLIEGLVAYFRNKCRAQR
jgi:hypothetical protein